MECLWKLHFYACMQVTVIAFSALTLLVGWQEGHLACKNWVVGCWRGYLCGARCTLAYGPADATVSCFSKIQIVFTFLVPSHPGSPGKRAIKRVCVCVCRSQLCNGNLLQIILRNWCLSWLGWSFGLEWRLACTWQWHSHRSGVRGVRTPSGKYIIFWYVLTVCHCSFYHSGGVICHDVFWLYGRLGGAAEREWTERNATDWRTPSKISGYATGTWRCASLNFGF